VPAERRLMPDADGDTVCIEKYKYSGSMNGAGFNSRSRSPALAEVRFVLSRLAVRESGSDGGRG
jgi:hypothetical protein